MTHKGLGVVKLPTQSKNGQSTLELIWVLGVRLGDFMIDK